MEASLTFAQEEQYDVGQYYPMLQNYADERAMSLSFLSNEWPDVDLWRRQGREKMQELLAFSPKSVPLDEKILETVEKKDYIRYKVRYSTTLLRKTEAFLLVPKGLKKPAPAIIALHDHSGFYYYGKEKITETENNPEILTDLITEMYEGRPFADELARRGFVVLCPDVFYFGSQRLDENQVPDYFTSDLRGDKISQDTNKYIHAFNSFCGSHENIMARYIFASGTTWPGIMFYDDQIAVDYLLTRTEVDPDRIGCLGLSLGGYRSAHLFGLDHRLKVGVVAGWMTTFAKQMGNKLRHHTWMVYIPRQLDFLDLPDVVTLNAPHPLMVINCKKDNLYTVEAMNSASEKIAKIYNKMGSADRFQSKMYDVPHSLNIQMQNDAISWLEKWLDQK